jgi:hypothetical protein
VKDCYPDTEPVFLKETLRSAVAIRLEAAWWCENCESIIDSAVSCPQCATTHGIVALANWLQRRTG